LVRLRGAVFGVRQTGHVSHCEECQAFYRAEALLEQRLRSSIPTAADPGDLAERIVRSLPKQAAAVPQRRFLPATLLAVAGSLAVFAFAFYLVRPRPQQNIHTQGANVVAVDVNGLVEGVDTLGSRLAGTVGPSAEKIVVDNPYTQELASMKTDARSALNFLAMNFLPDSGTGS
jgi:hypothetical protein